MPIDIAEESTRYMHNAWSDKSALDAFVRMLRFNICL
jgi:hypothetical protein